ncbi:protein of unknown function [Alteromonadaceae bacterium Bs31]|nr:protein of unknown function [Alteromonadaceae bacterium Bs31]
MLKKLRTGGIVLVSIILVLFSITWLSSPYVARLAMGKVLESEKVELGEQSSVRVNLFLSTVTVQNLTLISQGNRRLALETLSVHFSLSRLLWQEMRIDKILLQGLHVDIDLKGDDAHAAGFSLNRPQTDPVQEENQNADDSTSGRQVSIAVPYVELRDINLRLDNGEKIHELRFDDISIERSLYKNAVLSSQAQIQGTIDNADFDIEALVEYGIDSATIELGLNANQFALNHIQYLLPENIEELSGLLSLKVSSKISIIGKQISVKGLQANLELDTLNYRDTSYALNLERFDLTLSPGLMDLSEDNKLKFDGNFELNSQAFNLGPADSLAKITGFNSLKIEALNLQLDDADYQASIGAIDIERSFVSLLDQEKTPLPELAKLNNIRIESINLNNKQARIETVQIDGGKIEVLIDEQKNIANLIALPSADEASTSDKAPEENPQVEEQKSQLSENEATFDIYLGNLALTKPIEIVVSDKSIQPAFKENYFLETLSLTTVDTANTSQAASYEIQLHDGDFFKFKLLGSIAPFADKLNGEFKLNTSEFTLPEVSPYVSDALGFNIMAGQMDMMFDGTITDDILKSVADVHLRGTEFKSDKNYDEKDLLGQTAMPLNVALGLLKDDDGNIALKMPIDGDISSPDFSARHIIGLVVTKAAMSQAKSYLIKTFVPYGQVLSVAMAAGSYALKVRFEDLPYKPGQTIPEEPQITFSDQLSTLMTDKEALQIKICPIVIPGDVIPGDVAPGEQQQLAAKDELSAEHKALLLDLGEQRAANFKRYLIEQKSVSSARLLLCTPEIDRDPQASPRIKLSI